MHETFAIPHRVQDPLEYMLTVKPYRAHATCYTKKKLRPAELRIEDRRAVLLTSTLTGNTGQSTHMPRVTYRLWLRINSTGGGDDLTQSLECVGHVLVEKEPVGPAAHKGRGGECVQVAPESSQIVIINANIKIHKLNPLHLLGIL